MLDIWLLVEVACRCFGSWEVSKRRCVNVLVVVGKTLYYRMLAERRNDKQISDFWPITTDDRYYFDN